MQARHTHGRKRNKRSYFSSCWTGGESERDRLTLSLTPPPPRDSHSSLSLLVCKGRSPLHSPAVRASPDVAGQSHGGLDGTAGSSHHRQEVEEARAKAKREEDRNNDFWSAIFFSFSFLLLLLLISPCLSLSCPNNVVFLFLYIIFPLLVYSFQVIFFFSSTSSLDIDGQAAWPTLHAFLD